MIAFVHNKSKLSKAGNKENNLIYNTYKIYVRIHFTKTMENTLFMSNA
jgi:hypothetical protein